MTRDSHIDSLPATPSPSPEDFYLEGETIVFTEAYHLKRGNCCGSGCRHCPYEHRNVPGAAKNQGVDAPDADAPDDEG